MLVHKFEKCVVPGSPQVREMLVHKFERCFTISRHGTLENALYRVAAQTESYGGHEFEPVWRLALNWLEPKWLWTRKLTEMPHPKKKTAPRWVCGGPG